jgi:hypothetical protein
MGIASDFAMALDPVMLARAAGIEPDPWQGRLLRSQAKNILMLCARQVGKSTGVAMLATWVARYLDGAQILLLAPSERQSMELLRTTQAIWHSLESPIQARADTLTRMEFSNGSRILALPGSKGDSIRGIPHVDLLIIDEAARVLLELIAAARPMLAVSGGRLVLLSTPAGRRGWFFEEWEHGEGYQRFSVRADECPRISREFLASERAALGPTWFSQEYENQFVSVEGAVFPEHYLQRIISDEEHKWTIPPAPWANQNQSKNYPPIQSIPLSWSNDLSKTPEKDPRMTPYGVPWP